jgi:hypothetical protein
MAQASQAAPQAQTVVMDGVPQRDIGHGIGKSLVNMGAALSSANQPAQAAALARVAEGMDDGKGKFKTHFDPYTGTMYRIDEDGKITSAGTQGGKNAAASVMNPAALKTVAEKMDVYGTIHDVNTQAEEIKKLIDSGTLDLGAFKNWMNTGRNYAGLSNEQSRAFAQYSQFLETMRNDQLLLAKGVQTEGDAYRAMKQFAAAGSSYDNAAARSALNNVMRKNKQAIDRGSSFLAPYASKYSSDAAVAPLVTAHQGRLDWYKDKKLDNDDAETPATDMSANKRGSGTGGYKILNVR